MSANPYYVERALEALVPLLQAATHAFTAIGDLAVTLERAVIKDIGADEA